jgi:hypothetical protein
MRISRHAYWSVALVTAVLSLGCTGADGKQGPPGPAGHDGDAGVVPPLRNDVSGTVTDGQNPLEGVTVEAAPGNATAMTDASGGFSLPGLDVGAYLLTFHLAGYVDRTVEVAVNLSGPTSVSVTLAVDPDAVPPPVVAVTDQLKAGFDAPVTLTATAMGKGPLTYGWTQKTGPAVTLTGTDTPTLSFTTQDFSTAMGPTAMSNARFGVVGVSPDQAGDYVFEVAVTDPLGHTTKAQVHVDATRPTTGLRMVPLEVPVWLSGDGPIVAPAQKTWSWTLDTTGASGSTATLDDPTAQFPSFVPDVLGTYVVTETVSGKTTHIYGGTWMGEMTTMAQNTCTLCHSNTIAPDVFTPWKGTKHYSALQRALDGEDGASLSEETLLACTLGYDRTASNGGFDDVAATAGWTLPATPQQGDYDALLNTPKLGQLAGIQCESCHGPQGADQHGPHANSTNLDLAGRISWSSSVCASCHQRNPDNYKPEQWAESKHADLTLAYADATVEGRGTTAAHCGRCHSAQGFGQYVKQLAQGYSGLLTSDGKPAAPGNPSPNAATIASLTALGLTQATVEPQSCAACHDPHDATNPSQLRIHDAVASLPNGMTGISGAGAGMICIACHNTRNGEHSDFVAAPASYTAPHTAAQTDVVYGFNAYFVPRYNLSKHLAVKDSCVGCHTRIATASQQAAQQTSNHSFKVDNTICSACHSNNVDGAALQAGYQTQLGTLKQTIAGKVKNLINVALTPANGSAYTARVWDPASDTYSSAAASNVSLTAAPTSIDHFEIHGQFGFVLHLPSPVTVALVDASGNPAGSITTPDVYVPAGSLKNAAATTALFTASSDYAKALWNTYLLDDDHTSGVHNPGFYDAVLAATNVKVAALP